MTFKFSSSPALTDGLQYPPTGLPCSGKPHTFSTEQLMLLITRACAPSAFLDNGTVAPALLKAKWWRVLVWPSLSEQAQFLRYENLLSLSPTWGQRSLPDTLWRHRWEKGSEAVLKKSGENKGGTTPKLSDTQTSPRTPVGGFPLTPRKVLEAVYLQLRAATKPSTRVSAALSGEPTSSL